MLIRSITPETENASLDQGFSVADILEQRARKMRRRRKRVRTRAALLAVAARELEAVGYDSLTVDHLAAVAPHFNYTVFERGDVKVDVLLGIGLQYGKAKFKSKVEDSERKRDLRS